MTPSPLLGTRPRKTTTVKLYATFFGVFLLVMGLLVTAFGVAFVYFHFQAQEQTARFVREGRDASAVVVRKWQAKGSGSTTGSGTSRSTSSGSISYCVAVKYTPTQGTPRESVAALNSSSLWSATQVGEMLDIRYLDAKPEFVMAKKDDPDEPMEAEEWAILFGAALVFLLMAAGCFWVRHRFGHVVLELNLQSSRNGRARSRELCGLTGSVRGNAK